MRTERIRIVTKKKRKNGKNPVKVEIHSNKYLNNMENNQAKTLTRLQNYLDSLENKVLAKMEIHLNKCLDNKEIFSNLFLLCHST